MQQLFDIVFLEEAFVFLNGLDRKHYQKILYNIRRSQAEHDPELLKKLVDEIGNSECSTRDCNTGCWLSGIKQITRTRW